jgi:hypothetical protein
VTLERTPTPPPPPWASALLRRCCRRDRLEEIQGDMLELYERRVAEKGRAHARLCYWRDASLVCLKLSRLTAPGLSARGLASAWHFYVWSLAIAMLAVFAEQLPFASRFEHPPLVPYMVAVAYYALIGIGADGRRRRKRSQAERRTSQHE